MIELGTPEPQETASEKPGDMSLSTIHQDLLRIEDTLESLSTDIDDLRRVSGLEGVRDAAYAWFHEHPVSLGDLFREAVEKGTENAVSGWLDSDSHDVIDAIGAELRAYTEFVVAENARVISKHDDHDGGSNA